MPRAIEFAWPIDPTVKKSRAWPSPRATRCSNNSRESMPAGGAWRQVAPKGRAEHAGLRYVSDAESKTPNGRQKSRACTRYHSPKSKIGFETSVPVVLTTQSEGCKLSIMSFIALSRLCSNLTGSCKSKMPISQCLHACETHENTNPYNHIRTPDYSPMGDAPGQRTGLQVSADIARQLTDADLTTSQAVRPGGMLRANACILGESGTNAHTEGSL